jgi:hypothetical protein
MQKVKNKQKLYCYIDESGQDTMGDFFIVSVVITGDMRENLANKLEQIEKMSRKGKTKWTHSRQNLRYAYIKSVLSEPMFKHSLNFSFYHNTKAYTTLTILSTARAIYATAPEHTGVAVYVDGLPQSRVLWFGTELRHLGIRTSKVVGIRREESNALIRLADAFCGFVRQALVGKDAKMIKLFEKAKKGGYINEV